MSRISHRCRKTPFKLALLIREITGQASRLIPSAPNMPKQARNVKKSKTIVMATARPHLFFIFSGSSTCSFTTGRIPSVPNPGSTAAVQPTKGSALSPFSSSAICAGLKEVMASKIIRKNSPHTKKAVSSLTLPLTSIPPSAR